MGYIAHSQKPISFSEDAKFCQELEHHIKVMQVRLCDLQQAASPSALGTVSERVCLPVKARGRKRCCCCPGAKSRALETEVFGS